MKPNPPGIFIEPFSRWFAVAAFQLLHGCSVLIQPTAGRHIEALEALIGGRLFNRLPSGLVPTEAARRLMPHAEAMAAAAMALQRASSGETRGESGIVRLAASELIGHDVLPGILRPFCAAYPGVVLELKLSNRNEDLLRGGADIAVRMVRPTQQALIAQRIGEVKLGLFAHRSYIDAFGMPKTQIDIGDHRTRRFRRGPERSSFLRLRSIVAEPGAIRLPVR